MIDKMDMKIAGSSTMPGGDYGTVSIGGSGKVTGNLRADTIRCSGAAKVLGNVTADTLDCTGACSLKGDVQVKKFHVSGSVKIEKNLSGEALRVSGAIKVEQTLRCKNLEASGGLSVGEDLEAEEVSLTGCAKIGKLLNAEKIVLVSSSTSKIRDIGCSILEVRKGKSSLLNLMFGSKESCVLEVNSIEADQAHLEYTRADVIRCRDLRLGPGCHVRRVEYTGSCYAEEGTVEELVKV